MLYTFVTEPPKAAYDNTCRETFLKENKYAVKVPQKEMPKYTKISLKMAQKSK